MADVEDHDTSCTTWSAMTLMERNGWMAGARDSGERALNTIAPPVIDPPMVPPRNEQSEAQSWYREREREGRS